MDNANGNIDNSVSANVTASIQSADQNSVSAISTNTPSIERDADEPSIIHAVPPSIHLDDLPAGVLSKIFNFVPIVEWPKLELTNHRIQEGTYDAWKKLKIFDTQKSVFPIHRQKFPKVPSRLIELLEKLLLRSPDMECFKISYGAYNSGMVDELCELLTKFEKMKKFNFGENSIDIVQLAQFLRDSSSRESIEEIDVRKSIIEIPPQVENAPQEDRPWMRGYQSRNLMPPAPVEARPNVKMSDGFGISANPIALRPVTINMERNGAKFPFDFLPSIDTSRLTSFNVRGSIVPQKFLVDFFARSPKLERVGFDICNCYERTEVIHDLDPQWRLMLLANKGILASIGRMENLKSLEMSMFFQCTGACDCKRFEKEFELLFHALSNRPSFAELTIANEFTRQPYVQLIAPVLAKLKKFKFLTNRPEPTMDTILRSQRVLDTLYVFSDSAAINDMTGSSATMRTLSVVFRDKTPSRRELLELTKFKELRELRLHCVGQHIDDDMMISWADAFGSNLTKFDMDDYQHVSIDCIVRFVQKCPKLQFLVINNSSIDDEGLGRVAALKPKIKILVLEKCKEISIVGLQSVVDGLKSLEELHYRAESNNLKMLVLYPWDLRAGKRVINYYEEYVSSNYWK